MDDLVHQEFSIGFPEGWEDRTEVIFAGPSKEGRNPSVTVKRIVVKVEMTLEQFVGFQAQALEVLHNVKKLDTIEEGETTLAGVPAHTRLYRLRFANRHCVQRQIYALRGQTAYVITTTSAPEHYADDAPIFDAIIKKFQIRPSVA